MTRPLIWLVLLIQAVAVLGANWNFAFGDRSHKTAQADRNDHGSDSVGNVVSGREGFRAQEPGAELVHAALSELRNIPKSSYARSSGQSSIFATAFRYIRKILPGGPTTAPTSSRSSPTISRPLSEAVNLLEKAASQNNSDALYLLAEFNFFGNYSHPKNLHAAFDFYHDLATSHGNATAQYMLAVYHSTGLGGVVPRDQAKALLYHTFAAAQGDLRSEMAVAYRYHAGIGTLKSCDKAVEHYKHVADTAIKWHRSGPPGGLTWVQQSWRIADEFGGVYGEGASASSAGFNAYRPSPSSDAHAAIGDVIEYLDLMYQKGDFKAAFSLGRIFYEGQRGLDPDIELAKKYFWAVASKYWKRDGRKVENYKPGIEKTACKAAGYIGRLYLRGESVPQNMEKAKIWFERGITHADAQSQFGLGLMLLKGWGGKKNIQRAMDLFRVSADQDYAPSQVEMGRLYLDQGGVEDLRIANNYFELAARHGNIESHYYLAEMVHLGVGREKLCGIALSHYKSVSERVEPLVSSWADANNAYVDGDLELAFLEYLMAAEQGYEKAQTNVAYMLDSEHSSLPVASWIRPQASETKQGELLDNSELALIQWTRSSRQSNIDALVKMGDYYYYGIGADRDINKAVSCYTGASDYSQSAQALYNLGWMHENGIGLTQDFHLAKRYYDHALAVNKEAYLPVTLSLMKLRMRSAWNTLTHGPIHSIQDEPKQNKDWSLSEWVANFIRDDPYEYEEEMYSDDLYDETIDGEEVDFDEGGVVESVLIIGLMTALVFLLWWRQRMQQAHAEADEARRREQGLPPHPPAANAQNRPPFQDWAANGVGL